MKEKSKICASGIGGQAVMEGIMMKNKEKYAVAVRKPDKTISIDVKEYKGITKGNKILALPFIRGVFNFVDSMILGIKSLTYSASFFEDEEEMQEEESKFEKWLIEKLGEKAEKVIMGLVVAVAILMSVFLFMVLPLVVADVLNFASFVTEKQVPIIEA